MLRLNQQSLTNIQYSETKRRTLEESEELCRNTLSVLGRFCFKNIMSDNSGASPGGKQSGSNLTEKNSLAAVLSKLQQIKTQGSLSSPSTSKGYKDNENAPGAIPLPGHPVSQKISSSPDKSLYKLTFAGSSTDVGLYVNIPNSYNPTLLPDAPISAIADSNDRLICRICRMGFSRTEEREKHLGRKSIKISCGCSDTCAKKETVYSFYLHLMSEKVKSSISHPLELSKAKVGKLETEDYPIVSQEWFHALEKGAPSTESLI